MGSVLLPEFALTVRQPWVWAILHAGKNVENREWPTRFRGRVAIHAAKGMTLEEYNDGVLTIACAVSRVPLTVPAPKEMTRGYIVGTVEIADCVEASSSPWFFGPYGFVLRDPQPLEIPIPCKGALGLWRIPEHLRRVEVVHA